MKKVKGIVLEVNEKELILLTSGGDYRKIPHPGGNIRPGEELTCRLPVPAWPKAALAASLLAAAVFLIAILPAGLPLFELIDKNSHEQGYLALDINPSLELAFNADLEVTALQPFNDEAVLLLKDLETGADLAITVELLLERAAALGYLDPGREDNIVLMTLVTEEAVDDLPQLLADLVQDNLLQYGISGSVGVFEAESRQRNEALQEEISLNRYLLMEALDKRDMGQRAAGRQTAAQLMHILSDNLPFSEFRPGAARELPPVIPPEAEGEPGQPDLTDVIPELPEQADSKSENRPALPENPAPVLPAPAEKPDPPVSLP